MTTYYLGVDIGGTFTDCVAVDDTGRIFYAKTPSTHGSSRSRACALARSCSRARSA
jgi:N-methylhydantoinase A/oxoprolinase/acetone carboxylase beta subunit